MHSWYATPLAPSCQLCYLPCFISHILLAWINQLGNNLTLTILADIATTAGSGETHQPPFRSKEGTSRTWNSIATPYWDGVDVHLTQLVIIATETIASMKGRKEHSLGIVPIIIYQISSLWGRNSVLSFSSPSASHEVWQFSYTGNATYTSCKKKERTTDIQEYLYADKRSRVKNNESCPPFRVCNDQLIY